MMKPNLVKRKLRRNEQSYGCWVTLSHPLIPELLSYGGFDWLAVDMEHSSIDIAQLLPLIISIEANGMVPLVRVGELNINLIKRVMDAGAYGIIAANVCSKQDAELVVNSVKYPPVGKRGVGLYRAQKYGEDFENYKKWALNETIVVVQIEHIDAVRNIDDIFSTPGIDAYLIGPYDLSGSLGWPGEFDRAEVKKAMQTVLEAAKKYKIVAGFHSVPSDPDIARKRCKEGYKFLAFSTDFMLLKNAAKDSMRKLKGI